MKLIIDIPKKVYNAVTHIEFDANLVVNEMRKSIANGTPIPDNATNGQVIQTLFKPNRVERTDDNVIVEHYDFNKDWWIDKFNEMFRQATALDKIRAEIEQLPITDTAIRLVTEIIDKYKAESEE